MPQQEVTQNWLPAATLVAALHLAAWWGLTHFKDDTTRPTPLAVVDVALLPPPVQPRVAPPPPLPEPPKPQPRTPPQPVAVPPQPVLSSKAADAPVMPAAPVDAPPQPVAAAPVAVAAPPPTPAAKPVAEPALEPPRYNAAYLSNPPPAYPLAARRRGIEGTALVRAEISAEGECLRAELKKSSGAEMLDQAALEAVRKWRFVPAKRGSQAVVAWVEVPLTFKLDN